MFDGLCDYGIVARGSFGPLGRQKQTTDKRVMLLVLFTCRIAIMVVFAISNHADVKEVV